MKLTANFLIRLIPITQFNRGQVSKIFDCLHSESGLIFLKNNHSSAVILSPDKYARLVEIEGNYHLLLEASKRLATNDGKPAIPIEDVMKHFEITDTDLAETEELEIE